ncbi:hypothetical protein [Cellulomonas sp.]|uniref:hypothetical protein n=1 Tax=Cellulomonas sp. TaxID=40001 RepID=UPI001B1BA5C6|nr:hypothetical protein [Cellulomonas sp.]MBO9555431.1 hypothetical protein [Cellulomonas sp.]
MDHVDLGRRAHRLRSTGVRAGGWLAQSVVAALCVEVTVDRHASPMVQRVDADRASELSGVPADASRVRLPTPWPPPARPTS